MKTLSNKSNIIFQSYSAATASHHPSVYMALFSLWLSAVRSLPMDTAESGVPWAFCDRVHVLVVSAGSVDCSMLQCGSCCTPTSHAKWQHTEKQKLKASQTDLIKINGYVHKLCAIMWWTLYLGWDIMPQGEQSLWDGTSSAWLLHIYKFESLNLLEL